MKQSDENQTKVIDGKHRGLKLAGRGLIVEGILICAAILVAYLFKRFG